MELFLDKKLTFEKLGMEYRLSEDPNEWPQQILDQLYRHAPFTSDYAPKVTLDTVDIDRRYALGKVELMNRLAINPRDDATPEGSRGTSKVVVPVVVQEGKLQPMDLLMHSGEVEPLTEERLRKALFRPTMFEAIKKRPGDISMVEQLYPPQRSGGGGRGGMVVDAQGMTRTASINKEAFSHVTPQQWSALYDDPKISKRITSIQKKRGVKDFNHPEIDNLIYAEAANKYGYNKLSSAKPEFLIDAILPTIKLAHVNELADALNSDHSMRAALFANDATVPFMAKLADVECSERPKTSYLEKVAHGIEPTVIQVKKVDGGFRIKTANPNTLIPTADDVARPAAVGTLGGDLVAKVESDGTTTITTHPAVKDTLEDMNIKVINEFGIYKVKSQGDNKEMVGWVFPKVMDLDGTLLPMAAFSNGSESAIQENIAGVPVARQTDVLDAKPEGNGCFYYATPSGAQALIPVEIKGEQETPDSSGYIAETMLGQRCVIVKTPGLKQISVVGEGRYAIPEECGFMPLENVSDLVSSPDEFTKTAEAMALAGNAVRVFTDGSYYTFEGKEIEKMATVMETQAVDKDDAVFIGAILGQEPEKFAHDLSSLRSKGQYEMWFGGSPITTFKDKYASAREAAAERLSQLPDLRANLIKEAAPIEDPTAVDKILSLHFLNPENVSIFASYVPEFEAVIKKLSELLLAARMGLDAVDEGAVQKSIVHLDKVVNGLRSLAPVPQA